MIHRSCCPLCRGEKYKIVEKIKSTNTRFLKLMESRYKLGSFLKNNQYTYELRFCLNCGTRYQGFVLDEKETEKLYSENINLKDSLFKQFKNFNRYFLIRKKTARLLNKLLNSNPKKS